MGFQFSKELFQTKVVSCNKVFEIFQLRTEIKLNLEPAQWYKFTEVRPSQPAIEFNGAIWLLEVGLPGLFETRRNGECSVLNKPNPAYSVMLCRTDHWENISRANILVSAKHGEVK